MEKSDLPDYLTRWISKELSSLGYSLHRPKELAPLILEVSDHFISPTKSTTPWEDRPSRAAYLSYFFPLNYLRCRKVVQEGLRTGFFSNLSSSYDFGCGPGPLSLAIKDVLSPKRWNYLGTDQSMKAIEYFLKWPDFKKAPDSFQWNKNSLLTFSYSLNELTSLPSFFYQAENILIIEPSTKWHSQNLIEHREILISKGYSIWAPCLHQKQCPLKQHKKDWCHFKTPWHMPMWFQKILEQLPMKNQVLGYSYLLASRRLAPEQNGYRIIGDPRKEKGKTRWLMCHPEERVFASLLKREGSLNIQRGDIVEMKDYEKKGNEMRIQLKGDV